MPSIYSSVQQVYSCLGIIGAKEVVLKFGKSVWC